MNSQDGDAGEANEPFLGPADETDEDELGLPDALATTPAAEVIARISGGMNAAISRSASAEGHSAQAKALRRLADSVGGATSDGAPVTSTPRKRRMRERGEPLRRNQYWNVACLSLAYTLYMCLLSGNLTVVSLAAVEVGAHPQWATLPFALLNAGELLACVPFSFMMARIGRKRGFIAGGVIAMCACVTNAAGSYVKVFALLCVGNMLLGAFGAVAEFLRFTASEVSTPAFRNRAIALVVCGGAVVSAFGPQLAARFTVSTAYEYYIVCLALCAVFLVACVALRLKGTAASRSAARFTADESESDGEEGEAGGDVPAGDCEGGDGSDGEQQQRSVDCDTAAADEDGDEDEDVGGDEDGAAPARALREVLRKPACFTAMMAGCTAQWAMILVMTATPLAMNKMNYSLQQTATTIQIHLLGMFLPGLFTGSLIDLLGPVRVVIMGCLCFCASLSTVLSGTALPHFMGGLGALGIGWNFTYIGSTRLLLASHRQSETAKVQAVNEVLLHAANTGAAFAAGQVLHHAGWDAVGFAAAPMVVLTLLLCISLLSCGTKL